MKYKYYGLKSKTKEAIGIVNAQSLDEAYERAAKKKQLNIVKFKKLFGIEQL